MIVRILGEGQVVLQAADLPEMNKLDEELMAAIEASDEARFGTTMGSLLAYIRAHGAPLPADEIKPSDFILPGAQSSMDEVRDLLSSDGLIPG